MTRKAKAHRISNWAWVVRALAKAVERAADSWGLEGANLRLRSCAALLRNVADGLAELHQDVAFSGGDPSRPVQ